MAQHGNSIFTALQATPTVGRTVKARDDGATRREIINALMTGSSPNAANALQRLGRDQIKQGSSGAPVQHFTQGINRALQGLVGGLNLREGRRLEEAAFRAAQARADDPLRNVRKNQAIAEALGIDQSTSQGKAFLTGGQFKPADPLADLKRRNLESQINARGQGDAPKFGVIGEDDFGGKRFGFIDAQNRSVSPVEPQTPQASFGGQVLGTSQTIQPTATAQTIRPGTDLGDGAVKSRFGFGSRASKELGIEPEAGAAEQAIANKGGFPGFAKPQANPETVQAVQQGLVPRSALSGEDFLSTIPQDQASIVRALVEGRMKFPSGRALTSPFWRRMIAATAQYEPGFDVTVGARRNKTASNFASGAEARNITSFNTAIGHLASLKEAAANLNNIDTPVLSLFNAPINFAARNLSPDFAARDRRFELTKQAVAEEMARAFKGQAGTLTELRAWEDLLNSSDSPQAINAAIDQGIELLDSRIEALGDQYNQGMSTSIDARELLSPKSRKILEQLKSGRAGDSGQPQGGTGQISIRRVR